jgi:hypothetical protein
MPTSVLSNAYGILVRPLIELIDSTGLRIFSPINVRWHTVRLLIHRHASLALVRVPSSVHEGYNDSVRWSWFGSHPQSTKATTTQSGGIEPPSERHSNTTLPRSFSVSVLNVSSDLLGKPIPHHPIVQLPNFGVVGLDEVFDLSEVPIGHWLVHQVVGLLQETKYSNDFIEWNLKLRGHDSYLFL